MLALNCAQPEVLLNTSFARLIVPSGNFEPGTREMQIDVHFKVDVKDVVAHDAFCYHGK